MKWLSVLEVAIGLLEGLAKFTATPLDDVGLAALEGAISKLKEVHATAVTKDQVESLRVTPQW